MAKQYQFEDVNQRFHGNDHLWQPTTTDTIRRCSCTAIQRLENGIWVTITRTPVVRRKRQAEVLQPRLF